MSGVGTSGEAISAVSRYRMRREPADVCHVVPISALHLSSRIPGVGGYRYGDIIGSQMM